MPVCHTANIPAASQLGTVGRDSGDEWQAYKGPVPLASVDDLISRYYNFALGKCGWRGTVGLQGWTPVFECHGVWRSLRANASSQYLLTSLFALCWAPTHLEFHSLACGVSRPRAPQVSARAFYYPGKTSLRSEPATMEGRRQAYAANPSPAKLNVLLGTQVVACGLIL